MLSRRSRMRATCAAASGVFTVMRTSSEPARASSATWSTVDFRSAVSVLVIDCTTTGAPPPIKTDEPPPPTRTWRDTRLVMEAEAGPSRQREACYGELSVGREVDRTVVVHDTHVRSVADDERERAARLHHALGALRVQRGHQHPLVRVLHLDPGLFLATDHEAVQAGGDLGDRPRRGRLLDHRGLVRGDFHDRFGAWRVVDHFRLRARRARDGGRRD